MSGQPETDDRIDAPGANADQRPGSDDTAGGPKPDAGAGNETLEVDGDETQTLLAELEKERLRQEHEIKDLTDRLMRAHAEMENLRKRTEREKADMSKYAITKFAMDVLAIGDNLQRAMDAAGDPANHSEEVRGLYDGVALTAQDFAKALEKNGVSRIEAKGAIFDPNRHQAMMEQQDPSVPSGTIMQVFQEGYTIGERVLRPSMVVVARGGAKPDKATQEAHPAPGADGGADGPADEAGGDAKPGSETETGASDHGHQTPDDGPAAS